MPDFTLKPTFPIATVIDAAQRKAQIEQQAKEYNQQAFVEGLKSIGQVGQSLIDTRRQIAQALTMGKQFGMTPQETMGLTPDQVVDTQKIKQNMIQMPQMMLMLHPELQHNEQFMKYLAPASTQIQPAQNAGQIIQSSDSSAPASNTPPTLPPINKATATLGMKAYLANKPENVMTKEAALAAGNVPHGTRIVEPKSSDTADIAYQDKLEKQYRDMRMKALSNRSGGLGLQDSKVNQAIDLRKLVNQYYDPKTKQYNVPPSQYSELALGLARLLSPSGQVGIELMKELKQGTGREALSKVLIAAGADPAQVGGPTQPVIRMFIDSIDRQGETAEQLRDQYMQYVSDNAPSNLDPDKKTKLDKGRLNSFVDIRSQAPDQHSGLLPPDKQARLEELRKKKAAGTLK